MPFNKKTLDELLAVEEPAWPLVKEWADKATKSVEVLPPATTSGESLVAMQVTTRSPLGSVIYHTGGLLIDQGWVRILGSGHPLLPRSLPAWNFSCGMVETSSPPPWVLVADDVIGGLFAINGGRFASEGHSVWYFAPDTLEWEDTEQGYTDFLHWCLEGDLDRFYSLFRWPGWQSEVRALVGDTAFSFQPALSIGDVAVEQRTRTAVPLRSLVRDLVGAV